MKHQDIVAEIAKRVPHNENARFLDVGCGSGWMIDEIIRLTGADGYGIDPFAVYHNRCRPLAAEELDRIKITFDVIYTVHSLHHFDDPERFFKLASEKLKPGGRLIVVDWQKGADTGVAEHYFDASDVVDVLSKWFVILEKSIIDRSFFIVASPIPDKTQ